jgi:nucleotide-binding universal stress UspA family protein
MFTTILLAVDDSKHSQRAAEVVKSLAEATKAVVVVLHVHEIAIGRWGRLRIDESSEDDFASAIAEELRAGGVNATVEIREVNYHEVARGIVQAADDLDAGLIVVGSRGRSDVGSLTLGSVSHKLLHSSQRPILVVPAI